ncbi:MAG: DUF364 domain-containing protein [Deltaproteobacteria bacterium]|nr:MAG: DUF364 domain-containing protein [Deltaproteobacteria bacterium]
MDASLAVHKKIKEHIMPLAKGIEVTDVRIGLGYTAVLLENGQAGVALTFHESIARGCTVFNGLHPLRGREARDLLAFLESTDKVEMAVALATANALANTMSEDLLEGDIMEHVHIGPKERVGMVGYFAPMLPRLKRKTSSITIFEQIERKKGNLLPEKDAYRLLPQCQVAMITSTSILNHTIDNLLRAARSCREVILLGASTPLIPEVFADTPVTFLSGVVVARPQEILRIVSEGGGMKFFKKNVKKVNLSLR